MKGLENTLIYILPSRLLDFVCIFFLSAENTKAILIEKEINDFVTLYATDGIEILKKGQSRTEEG